MNYGEALIGNPRDDRYMQFLSTTADWETGELNPEFEQVIGD